METVESLAFVQMLALALVPGSAFLHYEVLRLVSQALPNLRIIPRRMRVLFAVLGAMSSHLVQILLFAAAYFLAAREVGGSLGGGTGTLGFVDFMYFSTETYTSLGLGDFYPVGSLRLLVGVESITGLLMIGWTTSFTYLEMRRNWDPGLDH